MDVQNFRMLQNYKYKKQKLQETLNKQKSILQQLRVEYENLKKDKMVKTTPADKLKEKKNLRSIYTFKLPVNKQKNKENGNETPENTQNGWIQRPLSALPRKTQDLNKKRSLMIELGNSYSENNKKCPLATTKTIKSVKTQHEMKYEMLNRARQLGNHYSFRFRQHHPLKVYKKSIDSYKKHEHLINQKNEIEECFKNGEELPQMFPQKYLHVLNEIYRLEEELKLNHQFSDGKICQDILNSDTSSDQRLIDQLSYPIFDNLDVVSDHIQMTKAMEKIDIGIILEATKTVEQKISSVFWSKEEIEEETDLKLSWKNEDTKNQNGFKDEETAQSDGEIDFNEKIYEERADDDLEIGEVRLSVEENQSENEDEIKTHCQEVESENQQFDVDMQEIVIENDEIAYINEKFQVKNQKLDSKHEYLDRIELKWFFFKNLVLEISDQALKTGNDISLTSSSSPLQDHPSMTEIIEDSPITIISQELDTKFIETLKIFCKNYIEDLYNLPNIPKHHHPSLEDIQINFIHETTSNVDAGHKNDDSQEIAQVSHEICKSQSSILRTERVESSKSLKMTNDAMLDGNFITYSIEKKTSDDCKSYDNYSREMVLSSIENPQSAVTLLYG